jgi:hypothetical protein
LTSGKPHKKFRYGQAGDVPVVGSWTGRARDGIGVERDGAWLLRHKRKGGTANATFDFGGRRSRALAGDWDGDGRTSVGLVRGRTFRLRADVTDQARAPQQTFRG